ncbi:hypothetical protein [Vreelandella boliviensis]|uniref:Uncharacterized protein n=1 Tax=Vreelandella boliviensis LC1 TaxID=1072583 RepID=A0A265DT89_9GAMM|nr:hypothetical protein [Halomonas boliviensis]EHJ91474.1 hypothetical protein KUC_3024 [Halomonas boliviensis LC1]OZT72517.1 hypothetical protein CE457_18985 [Halomonas boliviensis LC1]
MMVKDKAYKEHFIFSDLDSYIDFYSSLAFSVMGFATMGTTAVVNMDTYLYSSIQGTVESIKLVLEKGRINDSYCLLRKYYDSAIINTYSNLYIKENFSAEKFFVAQINNWLHGKEQLPEYRVMSQYLRNSDRLGGINACLYSDDRYKRIRVRCNDHTHYNYFYHVMINDNEVYLNNRLSSLDHLAEDLRDIFILHLSYIFSLHQHYMMSSDYVDHLDCGMQPPKDSQYWVAPFIQKVFDEIIKKNRPDIASCISENTSMHLVTDHA